MFMSVFDHFVRLYCIDICYKAYFKLLLKILRIEGSGLSQVQYEKYHKKKKGYGDMSILKASFRGELIIDGKSIIAFLSEDQFYKTEI